MTDPVFKLVVVSTEDGFIAREPGHTPYDWASAEEQDIFFREVDTADWGIMGRGTHEAADKPHRRRIVFSGQVTAPEWRRDTQVWIDPGNISAHDLPKLVGGHHSFQTGLILGGTRVHDWFHGQGAIDEILLTVEPIRFGQGLPIFTNQPVGCPETVLQQAGYVLRDAQTLNATGTRLLRYERAD